MRPLKYPEEVSLPVPMLPPPQAHVRPDTVYYREIILSASGLKLLSLYFRKASSILQQFARGTEVIRTCVACPSRGAVILQALGPTWLITPTRPVVFN